jgi:hypothetical protein
MRPCWTSVTAISAKSCLGIPKALRFLLPFRKDEQNGQALAAPGRRVFLHPRLVPRSQAISCATRALGVIGVRNCTRDGGGPLGAGLQEQASNHLKLRWLRARVVSVKDKSRLKTVAGEVQGDEQQRTTDEVSKS